MTSQSIAGFLGAVVGAIVLAAAFYYVPVGPIAKPGQPVKANVSTETPVVPAAAPARGPVVKDVPN